MAKEASQETMALVWRNGEVLGIAQGDESAGDAWALLRSPRAEDESGEQACARMVAHYLSCRVSTSWLLDTLQVDLLSGPASIDCYVCTLPPDETPQTPAHSKHRWFSRNDLAAVAWDPASEPAILTIGRFWDHFFMSEHL